MRSLWRSKVLKIGILTYFRSNNPGTFLQALTVQRLFENTFPDAHVEIVDYRLYRLPWLPNRHVISPVQWYDDYKRHFKYAAARRSYLRMSPQRMVSRDYNRATEFIRRQHYDILVVGSDTILELQHYKGGIGPFWLSPDLPGRKIMFAASCRSEAYSTISDRQKEQIRASVAGFLLLGVRDTVTHSLLSHFVGQDSRLSQMPDPTFCFDIDFDKAERYAAVRRIPKHRTIVALHLPPHFSWAAELASLFRSKGCFVVSLGPASYADLVLTDVSPMEWAGLFKYFTAVVTSRFHDSVFCLKNLVPCVTLLPGVQYLSNHNDSKYHTLFGMTGMIDNLICRPDGMSAKSVYETTLNALKTFDEAHVAQCVSAFKSSVHTYLQRVNTICM